MAFLPVAQGLGRAGNEWSQATDQNLDRALKLIQSKLMIQEIQQRIKQSQQKQPQGMVGTPGGGTAGVTFDPTSGQFGQQPIIPDLPQGKYPTFKTPQEAEAFGLAHGDTDLVRKAQEIIRGNQRLPVEHPTEYSDWKKQNPQGTVEQWLATKKKYTKVGGGGGGGGQDEINAYAEDLKSGQITAAQIPAKVRGSVLAKLKREGAKVPKALSADEKKGVDTLEQAIPLMDDTLPLLEPMKNENGIVDGLKTRGYWQMYQKGIAPPEPYASYFQMAALARVLMIAPYLHGIRNPEFVKQIQQHMPNPESDTPKFMYDKTVKLRPVMERMLKNLKGGESAGTGFQIPSGSVAVKDESGKVIGSATPEQQQKGTYTPF